ncbi:MAG: GDSL-type esterase/lipase family protein [Candidatus Velthaea sp.]
MSALVTRLALDPILDPAVVYGSSSINLWTSMANDLKNERIVNAGFGGSTLEACAHFFERIVSPLDPASLLVYAGDNDIGDGRSPEHVLRSFRQLAGKVDRCCGPIPFGFISIKPSPARGELLDRIRRANELIRADMKTRPNGFYVPLFDAMLRDGKPRPELFLDDGLHLGPEGYELWIELLEPFRKQMFVS